MGAIDDVIARVRYAFQQDKDRGGSLLAKGSTSPAFPDSGYDLLQSYGYDALSDYLRLEHDLISRYVDYEEMDDFDLISSAIDIYADDASQPDTQIKRTVWVTSSDKNLQNHLDDWLHKRLRMDEEIWEIARSLVKYGNDFEELLINNEGVVGMNFLPAPTVRRVEGPRGELHGFIQDFKGRMGYSPQEYQKILAQRANAIKSIGDRNSPVLGGARDYMNTQVSALEPWEVTHFRLRGKFRRSVYGYCERASSKVSTTSGPKEIQHIQVGDEVFVLDNGRMVSAKVKNVVCNGEKKVFSVKTRHRENFATAEHPFLVVSKTHLLEYRAVKDLCKGDMLVIPRPVEGDGVLTPTKSPEVFDRVRLTPHGVNLVSEARNGQRYFFKNLRLYGADVFCSGSSSIDRTEFERVQKAIPALEDENAFVYHGRCRGNFVQCPKHVDADFAWFFGLLLGDGWTAQNHDVAIAVSLDEDLTERIRGCFRRYGLDPKDRFQRIIDEATGEETRVLRQLCAHSADFVDILKGLGFVNGSKNKRIPQWLFQSSRAIRESFIDGFVTADGWKVEQHGQKAFRVELANYDLVRDLKAVIDSLGWTCGNVCVRKARMGEVSTHPAMLGKAVDSGPGYIISFRKTPLFEGPFALEKVISVKEQETPPEPVYDIEVDHPAHNFVADGIVVHNSVLESSRWIWKRLLLMEDAAMIYRLQRAQERLAFYVDTGDLPPAEALAHVNRVRQMHRKKKFVNPSNNKMDMKFEPLSPDEDFYVPVRKGVEGTRIEVLGSPSWQHMDDVNYFKSKLLASLKVPKAYLAQEEGASKNVLSSEDVRFARSVLRVQRELRNGLKRMARVHLAALKVDPSRVDFEMNMTVPSAIYELAQIEVRNARADLATRMKEHVSLNWVLSNVYGLTDSDIERILKERSEDVVREGKAQTEVEKMSAQAQQAAAPSLEGAQPSVRRIRDRIDSTPRNQRKRITEQELFKGNREAEKRAEEKLDKLLRNDSQVAKRVDEIGGLVRDLAFASRR
jgi:intein/homing endonuclease